jgi:hypothetical protein
MTIVVQETAVNTVTVEQQQVLVVEQDQVRVVAVGTQGPPGPAGPTGPQGPSGTSTLPAGPEGSVVFKENNIAALDGAHFRYDSVTKSLVVGSLTNAVMDGGNF